MALADVFKKFSRKTTIIIAAAALVVIAAVVVCIVFARNGYLATTMRLLRIEGAVSLEDSNGAVKPVSNNLRFQSGDALNTGSDGLASVGLDNTKIITLQNDSRAEFKKKNKNLELKLTKGAVFFNVTEKLKSDEKFEIKTSTMTAGIRGTSGMIYYDAADGREALLITDGLVEVSATNPETGETKTAMVGSGQEIKVYLFFDSVQDSVAFSLTSVKASQLPKFAATRIAEDKALAKRVCDANNWNDSEVKKKAAEPETTTTAAPKTEPTTEATTEATTTTTTTAATTTSETTESTTVTKSTTAKPKATSTPKPTPTKKPTPKVTETSAETTPETAATTTQPASSEPTPPSGYTKSKIWGTGIGTDKKYICFKGSDYLGYYNGSWVGLTLQKKNTAGTTNYVLKTSDGTIYYTGLTNPNPEAVETTTAKPASTEPALPSGYSKYKSCWGESRGTKFICVSGDDYLGYEFNSEIDDGKWVQLTVEKSGSATTLKITFKTPDGKTYFTISPNQHVLTPDVTTKQTSSEPTPPSGYKKLSYGWNAEQNGSPVFICQKSSSDVSGSEYLGYDNGKWIDLTYQERTSGNYLDRIFNKSSGQIYFFSTIKND